MKLVFVHGRAQEGKDPVALKQLWEDTLQSGLEAAGLGWPPGIEVAFPFYGNDLARMVRQLDAPLSADVVRRGVRDADKNDPAARLRAEILEQIAAGAGIDEAQILEHFDAPAAERGPLNWEWVQAILAALDRTPLGSQALDLFTRDVAVYLDHEIVRETINQQVASAIGTGPCIVVSHSLGTVVAYDVLRGMTGSADWLHVTLGSPLGIEAIKRKLGVLLAPSRVGHWYNAYDERDVVALHPLDAAHFPVPLDPPIVNDGSVKNQTQNRHGIEGYLNDPEVARRIHAALA